ncbi:MAG TPA: sigma-70 family RNA polymerase sigma factor [Candidatus Eisenbacteria bacterium]
MSEAQDVTALLQGVTGGSAEATDRLLEIVYDELRTMARRLLGRERADHTLHPTDLVHEAYLKLIDQTRSTWQNEAHFLAIASQAMRRILVDHARRRGSRKRGQNALKLPLDDALSVAGDDPDTTLLALDLALSRLAGVHPDTARLVELRWFGGLTIDECARVLEISPRTVTRDWEFAQTWLFREMGGDESGA